MLINSQDDERSTGKEINWIVGNAKEENTLTISPLLGFDCLRQ